MKSKVISDEQLTVLGSRAKQWSVLDDVTGRNLQKGLVTFELTENFDRFFTQSHSKYIYTCRFERVVRDWPLDVQFYFSGLQ